jgi:hypothetical protein
MCLAILSSRRTRGGKEFPAFNHKLIVLRSLQAIMYCLDALMVTFRLAPNLTQHKHLLLMFLSFPASRSRQIRWFCVEPVRNQDIYLDLAGACVSKAYFARQPAGAVDVDSCFPFAFPAMKSVRKLLAWYPYTSTHP